MRNVDFPYIYRLLGFLAFCAPFPASSGNSWAAALTHKDRIFADRVIAIPIAFLFNVAARILGKVMRRDHTITSSNVDRIVVAKLIGMGSILQATPLLKALKQHYPRAIVTFVTMQANRELLTRLSCVDEIIVLDDRNVFVMTVTTMRAVAALFRQRADLYFDLEVYSAFSSLLALSAATRNRIGFYRHSVNFKRGIYTHLVYFNTRMSIRQLYLQLGRVAGVPAGQSDLIGPIRVDYSAKASVLRFLEKSSLSQQSGPFPYIVVNPNASDLLLERRWPSEYFIETLSRLVDLGHHVALIGMKSELPYVQSLFDRLTPEVQSKVVNTAGHLNLGELLALLDGAACVLTNDTGPMHMSIALQRPTVCLFGPANPEHYGQELDYVEIFYSQVFCSPCLYEADEPPCHGNNVCMRQIQPDAVIRAVLRLAAPGPREKISRFGKRSTDVILSDAADGTPLGLVVRASLKPVGNAQ